MAIIQADDPGTDEYVPGMIFKKHLDYTQERMTSTNACLARMMPNRIDSSIFLDAAPVWTNRLSAARTRESASSILLNCAKSVQ